MELINGRDCLEYIGMEHYNFQIINGWERYNGIFCRVAFRLIL